MTIGISAPTPEPPVEEAPTKLLVTILPNGTAVSEVVPLTDAEIAQRDADQQAEQAAETAAAKAAAARDMLIQTLRAAKADNATIQNALADLLER